MLTPKLTNNIYTIQPLQHNHLTAITQVYLGKLTDSKSL